MNIQEAYNIWAEQYDTNLNKTRDMEAEVLKYTLENIFYENCLEIGCGTGKNTSWLAQKAGHVTAVDFSEEMLQKAASKNNATNVEFKYGDINLNWDFTDRSYDLVTFSLVLEHLEDLNSIFKKTFLHLNPGAYVYIGELHPFRQYSGSKARFETDGGTQEVVCYIHHVSDFTKAATAHGLEIVQIGEYFDDNNRNLLPRLLTLLLRKK